MPRKKKSPRSAPGRRESEGDKKRRARLIARRLGREYPDATCSLRHDSPLELLVATILSAQCTDERVNQVTLSLFRKYRKARDYSEAPPGILEEDIRSTGFFNQKAKSLRGMGKALHERHRGEVPRDVEALVKLPGVARKTANVVLGTAFSVASGVVVDTHVRRLSGLLKLSGEEVPEKIEKDLMGLLPRSQWIGFSHRMIHHGRRICIARRPQCEECVLASACPSAR